jgi:hypothetical protein
MDVKIGRYDSVRARVGGENRAINVMALAMILAVGHLTPSFASGDAAHGATIYRECMICHSLIRTELAPDIEVSSAARPGVFRITIIRRL